jgi:hypothetical protein
MFIEPNEQQSNQLRQERNVNRSHIALLKELGGFCVAFASINITHLTALDSLRVDKS